MASFFRHREDAAMYGDKCSPRGQEKWVLDLFLFFALALNHSPQTVRHNHPLSPQNLMESLQILPVVP